MQRLEVSGAVRLIYWSLGVKRLNLKIRMQWKWLHWLRIWIAVSCFRNTVFMLCYTNICTICNSAWCSLAHDVGKVSDWCVISRDTSLITPDQFFSQFTSAAITRNASTSPFLLICWRLCVVYTYGFHVFQEISSPKPYRHRYWPEDVIRMSLGPSQYFIKFVQQNHWE